MWITTLFVMVLKITPPEASYLMHLPDELRRRGLPLHSSPVLRFIYSPVQRSLISLISAEK